MSSAVTLDGQEIKIVPEGSVAGPIHTVVLIVMLFGGAGLMYFSSGRVHGTEQPNRVSFYLTTMAWEWFLTGYVLWGVRRYGKSLLEVTGARWTNAKDVFRDLGIALAFSGVTCRSSSSHGQVTRRWAWFFPRRFLESATFIRGRRQSS